MDIQNKKEGMNMEPVISKSRQLYIERINVVQDYMENHLDEEINI